MWKLRVEIVDSCLKKIYIKVTKNNHQESYDEKQWKDKLIQTDKYQENIYKI